MFKSLKQSLHWNFQVTRRDRHTQPFIVKDSYINILLFHTSRTLTFIKSRSLIIIIIQIVIVIT